MQNETPNRLAIGKPRFLDQLRHKCRLLHDSIRTEKAYADWVIRFLKFHRTEDGTWIHPAELDGAKIARF